MPVGPGSSLSPVLAGWNYNPKFREVSAQRAYEHGPLPYQQVPCAMMQ
jgi:hypothetical protein